MNCNLTAVNYEQITSEIVKHARDRGLLQIQLVQPVLPPPTPIFDFDNEQCKNSPYFIHNEYMLERANELPLEPTKASHIVLVTLNQNDQAFEWKAQQLVALQKRFD